MLGWFKKKFGRKKKAEPEQAQEESQEIAGEALAEAAPEPPEAVAAPGGESVGVDQEPGTAESGPEEESEQVVAAATAAAAAPPAAAEAVPPEEQQLEEPPQEPEPLLAVEEKAPRVAPGLEAGQPPVAEPPAEASAVFREEEGVEEQPGGEAAVALESRDAVVEPHAEDIPGPAPDAGEQEEAPPQVEPIAVEPELETTLPGAQEAPSPAISEEEQPVQEEPARLQVEAVEPGEEELPEPPVAAEPALAAREEAVAEVEFEEQVDEEPAREVQASPSLFRRLQERLGKTRDAFVHQLDSLFLGRKEIDQELFDELEEVLITADLGVTTTMDLLEDARKRVKRDKLSDPQSLKGVLRERILSYIEESDQPAELVMPEKGPFVIMVVGVNGVGKTTTIGKVAAKFVRSGQSVLLVAGDTFRAAAINQLKIWGDRVGVKVVAQKPGSDPASVVFDGMEYGLAHDYDVILIDTAGRLHTSVNLMEELKKIKRVIGKKLAGAPHEVMLVLDATTGQNGLIQARMFQDAVQVSGLAMTKLDGTAKGGIVANICREAQIPVRFIGIGEQVDDLRDFDARQFVDALFAVSEEA